MAEQLSPEALEELLRWQAPEATGLHRGTVGGMLVALHEAEILIDLDRSKFPLQAKFSRSAVELIEETTLEDWLSVSHKNGLGT